MADAYLTRPELYQLTLPASTFAPVPAEDQDLIIEANSRVADSYMRSQTGVPVPTASVTLEVKRQVAWMSARDILIRRGLEPGNDTHSTIVRMGERAETWFGLVGTNKVSLGLPAGDATPNVVEGAPEVITSPQRGW